MLDNIIQLLSFYLCFYKHTVLKILMNVEMKNGYKNNMQIIGFGWYLKDPQKWCRVIVKYSLSLCEYVRPQLIEEYRGLSRADASVFPSHFLRSNLFLFF